MLMLTLEMVDDWLKRFRGECEPIVTTAKCPYTAICRFLQKHKTITTRGAEDDVAIAILCGLLGIPFERGIPSRRWAIEIGLLSRHASVVLLGVRHRYVHMLIGGYTYSMSHGVLYPAFPPIVYERAKEVCIIPHNGWLPSMTTLTIVDLCVKKRE
jgi:hypothetical protein